MEHVNATCVYSGIDFSKEKRTPHILLQFETADGETLYSRLWLTENAFDKTEGVLRGVFGWFGSDAAEFYDNHDLLNGIEVDLAYEIEMYNGKERKDVRFINPVGGVRDAVTQMTRDEAVALGESLRGKFMLAAQKREQGGGVAQAAPKPAKKAPKAADRSTPTPGSPGQVAWKNEPTPDAPPEPVDDLPF